MAFEILHKFVPLPLSDKSNVDFLPTPKNFVPVGVGVPRKGVARVMLSYSNFSNLMKE